MRCRIEGRSSYSGSFPPCSHEDDGSDGCFGPLLHSEVVPSDINICENGKLEGNGSSTSIDRCINESGSSASNASCEAGSDKFRGGCSGKS